MPLPSPALATCARKRTLSIGQHTSTGLVAREFSLGGRGSRYYYYNPLKAFPRGGATALLGPGVFARRASFTLPRAREEQGVRRTMSASASKGDSAIANARDERRWNRVSTAQYAPRSASASNVHASCSALPELPRLGDRPLWKSLLPIRVLVPGTPRPSFRFAC